MPIKLYNTPDQYALAKALAKLLQSDKRTVFQPIYIISPNPLQDSWLKEQLVEELGVVAHLKFMRAEEFFDWVAYKLNDGQKEDIYSLEQLDWIAFDLLNNQDLTSSFPQIASYCEADDIKRFALAQKAVRLLDKYGEYQPGLIAGWKEEVNPEEWQSILFEKLKAKLGNKLLDKGRRLEIFQRELENPYKKSMLQELLNTLYFWGPLTWTPTHLELVGELSAVIELKLFIPMQNKGKQHSLDESWGTMEKELKEAMEKAWPDATWEELPNGSPSATTLLSSLQGHENNNSTLDDSSVAFHSCHTRMREVETLYNDLVKAVDSNPQLGARDILVFTPQLDPYIAAIKTVFDTAPYKFPYQFIAKGFSKEESFWSAMEGLLALEADEFTASKVFQVIEYTAIRESFAFEDLDLLRMLIDKANIRRDLEGNEELETRYSSWQYGLKRLMYGYCLGDENPFDDGQDSLYPVDHVEGKEGQELIKLYHFVQLLDSLVKDKQENKTLLGWLEWVDQVARTFFVLDGGTAKALQHQLRQIGSVGELFEEEISFRLFFYRFRDVLAAMEQQQLKGFGGITFSDLKSGRSLPKKMVAFIGMNFGEFPRKERPLSFDLSRGHGPSTKLTDLSNFWQAFKAASEKVFISWLGQSDKDNAELPASTLVEELLDMAIETTGKSRKELLIQHPLHAHSNKYNRNGSKLVNYLHSVSGGIDFNKKETAQEDWVEPENIELKQLESFLKDPYKQYYNKVLGIYYGEEELAFQDSELFEINNLQGWGIKYELLHQQFENSEVTRKEMVKKGLLPLVNVGEKTLRDLEVEVKELKTRYQQLLEGEEPVLEAFNIPFECYPNLIGELTKFPNGEYFFITPSKNKIKYKLAGYLRLLVLKACRNISDIHYLTADIPHGKKVSLEITQEDALTDLKALIKMYLLSRKELFPMNVNFDFKCDIVQDWTLTKLKEEMDKNMERVGENFFPSKYFQKTFDQDWFADDTLPRFKELYLQILPTIEKIYK